MSTTHKRWTGAFLALGLIAVILGGLSNGRGFVAAWYAHRLGSPSPEARIEAARRLGGLKVRRTVRRLVERLAKEETPIVRDALIVALGEMGPDVGDAAIETLVLSVEKYTAPMFT